MVVPGSGRASPPVARRKRDKEEVVPRMDMSDAEYEAQFLREGVASRIRRLRVLVDSIEREAQAALRRAEEGTGRYAEIPQIFVKELAWGLANVSVDQLVYTATNADVYAAEEKLKKKTEGKE